MRRQRQPEVRGDANAPCFISVVRTEQRYGGPEEGGWWYTSQERVENHYAATRELRSRLIATLKQRFEHEDREISSVLSEGQYDLYVGTEPAPEIDPPRRPHYE